MISRNARWSAGIFPPLLAVSIAALAVPAEAQQPPPGSGLSIELNAVEPAANGCGLTFVVVNGSQTAVSRAAFEFVFFDREGLVEKMTVLDFKDVPAGRTRVRQFALPAVECSGLGRVLLNGAAACEGGGDLCRDGLSVASRTDIEFIN